MKPPSHPQPNLAQQFLIYTKIYKLLIIYIYKYLIVNIYIAGDICKFI